MKDYAIQPNHPHIIRLYDNMSVDLAKQRTNQAPCCVRCGEDMGHCSCKGRLPAEGILLWLQGYLKMSRSPGQQVIASENVLDAIRAW